MQRVVGGLEVALKFARSDDLEQVINAARTVGWAPDVDTEYCDVEKAGDWLLFFSNAFIIQNGYWSNLSECPPINELQIALYWTKENPNQVQNKKKKKNNTCNFGMVDAFLDVWMRSLLLFSEYDSSFIFSWWNWRNSLHWYLLCSIFRFYLLFSQII